MSAFAASEASHPPAPVLNEVVLERHLGPLGLSVHYVASVLGAGVLILPGVAMQIAGPASIIAWIILIGFSYLFAWVLARLSVRYPDCHGLPLFIRMAFGKPLERGAALLLGLAIAGGIIPVYGIAAARRLDGLGVVPSHWPPSLVGLMIVSLAAAFGIAGLKLGARVQIWLLGLVVGLLLLAIGLAVPHADTAKLSAPVPDGWSSIGVAVAICFFAVIGWENAAPLAEEVRNPERTVPRAAMLGVTAVGLLYLAFAITLVMTVPRNVAQGAIAPVTVMLATAVGAQGERVGDMLSLALIFIAANAWVLTASRLVCGLARRSMLPSTFAELSPRRRTPVRACVLVGGTGAFALLAAFVFGLEEPDIMSATSSTFLVIYILVVGAFLKLLHGQAERVIGGLTLTVLLVMGSIFAAATLIVVMLLTASILLQKLAGALSE
jgi:amino acid efflux transporter